MTKDSKALAWIPSLYFIQGLPYVVVMTVTVIMYKRLGVSNADIALFTSLLYFPWTLKPIWSPAVDISWTKRSWTWSMQLVVGVAFVGVVFALLGGNFFWYTFVLFAVVAVASATHDIAADGFYMLALPTHQQALFVGVRSTFYRVAMIFGQGLIVLLAGFVESSSGLPDGEFHVAVSEQVSEQQDAEHLPLTDTENINSLAAPLQLSWAPMATSKADSLKAAAKHWNEQHGFIKPEATADQGGSTQVEPEEASGWVDSLEEFIRSTFGPKQPVVSTSDEAGRVALVPIRIGQDPGNEELVLNIDGGTGDIRLVQGERLSFTHSNWQEPAYAVVQLDPKLSTSAKASFTLRAGNVRLSWVVAFVAMAAMMLLAGLYHRWMMPRPPSDGAPNEGGAFLGQFGEAFASFFRQKRIGLIVAFLLVYRLGESQLVKLASPFLLDPSAAGGLGLTTGQVGLIYGTFGIAALTAGGLIGGYAVSRKGLKYWLWWMLAAINLPNLVYVLLAYSQTDSFTLISIAVSLEQFGYGFGFTAYLLYCIYVADGPFKTAHYAITTGFMALGMMIPGMVSGWLQELIGYQHFFIWVLIATIPSFVVTALVPLDPAFGKKTN